MKYLIFRFWEIAFPRRRFFLFISVLGITQGFVFAQDAHSDAPVHQTATEWPGINFKVLEIRHILQNRLWVIIEIEADNSVPAKGVFLGKVPAIPEHTKPENMFHFNPTPFSIMGSTMIDEQTGMTYPSLSPVAPPNTAYFPSATLQIFTAGTHDILSLQFACPPPPPPPPLGQKPTLQTLSFLFPKAKEAIKHVPLPPPLASPKTP